MTDTDKPSKEELVRFLAVEGMGYTLGESLTGDPHWLPPESNCAIPVEEFDPLADANDLLKLIAEIFKRFKLRVCVVMESTGEYSAVCLSADVPPEYVCRPDIKDAVCRAVHKALLAKEKP